MPWKSPETDDPSMVNICQAADGFTTRRMHIDDVPCDQHCQHMTKDYPCCCCGHTWESESWYHDHDEELEKEAADERNRPDQT